MNTQVRLCPNFNNGSYAEELLQYQVVDSNGLVLLNEVTYGQAETFQKHLSTATFADLTVDQVLFYARQYKLAHPDPYRKEREAVDLRLANEAAFDCFRSGRRGAVRTAGFTS